MAKLISTNPGKNYEEIGSVDVSTPEQIHAAVASARKVFENWGQLPVAKRVSYMQKIYDAFESRKDEIALVASREMGMALSDESAGDVGDGLHYMKWYIENAERLLAPEISHEDDTTKHVVYHEPVGVVAAITPWNFPFSNFVWAIVPQLLSGNTVVFKHSEECPLVGKLIDEIIQATKIPAGVFVEVYGAGNEGKMLLDENIDMVTFTGSAATGKLVYQKAASKFIRALLELGGSAPAVVFEDADIADAVAMIYNQRFFNNGQICDGLKRLIVHESIIDEVTTELKKVVEKVVVGYQEDATTQMGPLVAKRQLQLLESQVKDAVDKGAKVVTGGKAPAALKGAYFAPTILTHVTPDMRVWREEVFGPVLPIVSFKDEAQAVQLANDTQYGLGGYVYSKDLKRAERVAKALKTGMVNINNTNYVLPCNPFGGYKSSGMGREHGKWGFAEMTQVKVVAYPKEK